MSRSILAAVVACLLTCHMTHAETIVIDSTFSGGLYEDGSYSHAFMNYYVGYSIPSSPVERRNYFVFDLSGVTEPIIGASLLLYQPGDPDHPGEPCGYISPSPTEDYLLTGSTFPWTAFAEAFGSPSVPPPMIAAMFDTLGMGVPFGVTTVSVDTCGKDVEIDITPEGLMALNMSIGDSIVMGGRLTELMDTPGVPPSELSFAYTDIPNPLMPLPRLVIETIPEPVSAVGLLAGVMLAGSRRRAL